MADLGFADVCWIGLGQALTLMPGVSRCGIAMSTAMLRNTDRFPAARFSFLLSTPIIVGAGLLEALCFVSGGLDAARRAGSAPEWAMPAVGTASAFDPSAKTMPAAAISLRTGLPMEGP